jgi:ubiquinone/menaquinone biosynthesis C-methylase UbiE
MEDFVEASYKRYQERKHELSAAEHERAMAGLEEDTVDRWRHERFYQLIGPVLAADRQAMWLTVGDGRYGCDARYIKNGCGRVLATDISEALLREAAKAGYIDSYQVENAESLSFADGTFDYVLCKESFHHFPRPYVALHEMLRVAKKGVILIEPNDKAYARTFKVAVFSLLGALGKKQKIAYDWWEEGCANYVFLLDKREITKLSIALNYKYVAFKGINDVYIPGCEDEKMADNGPLQKRIKKKIGYQNALCKTKVTDYGLLCAIIFKSDPGQPLLDELRKGKYEVEKLTENPYM